MIPSDQQEIYSLAERHPSIFAFQGHRLKNYFDGRAVVVIANPRSGSTLLMRLLMHACLTHCIGDRVPSFYEGLIQLHKGMFNKHYQYREALSDKNFPDMYCGYDRYDHHFVSWGRLLSNALFCRMSGGHCKTTMIGWANDNVKDFVDMLRFTFEDLVIVWLTRDPREVAKSLIAREGGKLYGKEEMFPDLVKLAEHQQKQFAENFELGDVRLKYPDFLTNTKFVLRKLHPAYSVNEPLMEKILAHKLR